MEIDKVHQGGHAPEAVSGVQRVRDQAFARPVARSEPTPATEDQLLISAEAWERNALQRYVEMVKALPDVRESVVEAARRKLDARELDRAEVFERTAEKMLRREG